MKLTNALLILWFGTVAGCATETATLNEYAKKLQWVQEADANEDAEAALENKDFRLLALPGRGNIIPGVEPDKTNDYALKCGTRTVPGMTDAVQGEDHLRLLKMARQYAEDYNKVIKRACQP